MEIIIKCSDDCRGNTKINGEPIEEIVRCGACKHYKTEFCAICNYCDVKNDCLKDDDFCSYGERKDD